MTTADLRSGRIAVTVVIPLEWSGGAAEPYRVEEMARYLDGLRLAVAEVVVVDGSDAPVRGSTSSRGATSWDSARTLVNVVLASDWPGTFALRRSTLPAGECATTGVACASPPTRPAS